MIPSIGCLLTLLASSTLGAYLPFSLSGLDFPHRYKLPDGADKIVPNIKETFSCEGRQYGYYADYDNNCQIYHVCNPIKDWAGNVVGMQHHSFVCGVGTVFNQLTRTCTFAFMAPPCEGTNTYYDVNDDFGKIDTYGRKAVQDIYIQGRDRGDSSEEVAPPSEPYEKDGSYDSAHYESTSVSYGSTTEPAESIENVVDAEATKNILESREKTFESTTIMNETQENATDAADILQSTTVIRNITSFDDESDDLESTSIDAQDMSLADNVTEDALESTSLTEDATLLVDESSELTTIESTTHASEISSTVVDHVVDTNDTKEIESTVSFVLNVTDEKIEMETESTTIAIENKTLSDDEADTNRTDGFESTSKKEQRMSFTDNANDVGEIMESTTSIDHIADNNDTIDSEKIESTVTFDLNVTEETSVIENETLSDNKEDLSDTNELESTLVDAEELNTTVNLTDSEITVQTTPLAVDDDSSFNDTVDGNGSDEIESTADTWFNDTTETYLVNNSTSTENISESTTVDDGEKDFALTDNMVDTDNTDSVESIYTTDTYDRLENNTVEDETVAEDMLESTTQTDDLAGNSTSLNDVDDEVEARSAFNGNDEISLNNTADANESNKVESTAATLFNDTEETYSVNNATNMGNMSESTEINEGTENLDTSEDVFDIYQTESVESASTIDTNDKKENDSVEDATATEEILGSTVIVDDLARNSTFSNTIADKDEARSALDDNDETSLNGTVYANLSDEVESTTAIMFNDTKEIYSVNNATDTENMSESTEVEDGEENLDLPDDIILTNKTYSVESTTIIDELTGNSTSFNDVVDEVEASSTFNENDETSFNYTVDANESDEVESTTAIFFNDTKETSSVNNANDIEKMPESTEINGLEENLYLLNDMVDTNNTDSVESTSPTDTYDNITNYTANDLTFAEDMLELTTQAGDLAGNSTSLNDVVDVVEATSAFNYHDETSLNYTVDANESGQSESTQTNEIVAEDMLESTTLADDLTGNSTSLNDVVDEVEARSAFNGNDETSLNYTVDAMENGELESTTINYFNEIEETHSVNNATNTDNMSESTEIDDGKESIDLKDNMVDTNNTDSVELIVNDAVDDETMVEDMLESSTQVDDLAGNSTSLNDVFGEVEAKSALNYNDETSINDTFDADNSAEVESTTITFFNEIEETYLVNNETFTGNKSESTEINDGEEILELSDDMDDTNNTDSVESTFSTDIYDKIENYTANDVTVAEEMIELTTQASDLAGNSTLLNNVVDEVEARSDFNDNDETSLNYTVDAIENGVIESTEIDDGKESLDMKDNMVDTNNTDLVESIYTTDNYDRLENDTVEDETVAESMLESTTQADDLARNSTFLNDVVDEVEARSAFDDNDEILVNNTGDTDKSEEVESTNNNDEEEILELSDDMDTTNNTDSVESTFSTDIYDKIENYTANYVIVAEDMIDLTTQAGDLAGNSTLLNNVVDEVEARSDFNDNDETSLNYTVDAIENVVIESTEIDDGKESLDMKDNMVDTNNTDLVESIYTTDNYDRLENDTVEDETVAESMLESTTQADNLAGNSTSLNDVVDEVEARSAFDDNDEILVNNTGDTDKSEEVESTNNNDEEEILELSDDMDATNNTDSVESISSTDIYDKIENYTANYVIVAEDMFELTTQAGDLAGNSTSLNDVVDEVEARSAFNDNDETLLNYTVDARERVELESTTTNYFNEIEETEINHEKESLDLTDNMVDTNNTDSVELTSITDNYDRLENDTVEDETAAKDMLESTTQADDLAGNSTSFNDVVDEVEATSAFNDNDEISVNNTVDSIESGVLESTTTNYFNEIEESTEIADGKKNLDLMDDTVDTNNTDSVESIYTTDNYHRFENDTVDDESVVEDMLEATTQADDLAGNSTSLNDVVDEVEATSAFNDNDEISVNYTVDSIEIGVLESTTTNYFNEIEESTEIADGKKNLDLMDDTVDTNNTDSVESIYITDNYHRFENDTVDDESVVEDMLESTTQADDLAENSASFNNIIDEVEARYNDTFDADKTDDLESNTTTNLSEMEKPLSNDIIDSLKMESTLPKDKLDFEEVESNSITETIDSNETENAESTTNYDNEDIEETTDSYHSGVEEDILNNNSSTKLVENAYRRINGTVESLMKMNATSSTFNETSLDIDSDQSLQGRSLVDTGHESFLFEDIVVGSNDSNDVDATKNITTAEFINSDSNVTKNTESDDVDSPMELNLMVKDISNSTEEQTTAKNVSFIENSTDIEISDFNEHLEDVGLNTTVESVEQYATSDLVNETETWKTYGTFDENLGDDSNSIQESMNGHDEFDEYGNMTEVAELEDGLSILKNVNYTEENLSPTRNNNETAENDDVKLTENEIIDETWPENLNITYSFDSIADEERKHNSTDVELFSEEIDNMIVDPTNGPALGKNMIESTIDEFANSSTADGSNGNDTFTNEINIANGSSVNGLVYSIIGTNINSNDSDHTTSNGEEKDSKRAKSLAVDGEVKLKKEDTFESVTSSNAEVGQKAQDQDDKAKLWSFDEDFDFEISDVYDSEDSKHSSIVHTEDVTDESNTDANSTSDVLYTEERIDPTEDLTSQVKSKFIDEDLNKTVTNIEDFDESNSTSNLTSVNDSAINITINSTDGDKDVEEYYLNNSTELDDGFEKTSANNSTKADEYSGIKILINSTKVDVDDEEYFSSNSTELDDDFELNSENQSTKVENPDISSATSLTEIDEDVEDYLLGNSTELVDDFGLLSVNHSTELNENSDIASTNSTKVEGEVGEDHSSINSTEYGDGLELASVNLSTNADENFAINTTNNSTEVDEDVDEYSSSNSTELYNDFELNTTNHSTKIDGHSEINTQTNPIEVDEDFEEHSSSKSTEIEDNSNINVATSNPSAETDDPKIFFSSDKEVDVSSSSHLSSNAKRNTTKDGSNSLLDTVLNVISSIAKFSLDKTDDGGKLSKNDLRTVEDETTANYEDNSNTVYETSDSSPSITILKSPKKRVTVKESRNPKILKIQRIKQQGLDIESTAQDSKSESLVINLSRN